MALLYLRFFSYTMHYFSSISFKGKVVLLLGLFIQIITTITAVGYLHPDQHFQYMEFASYWLGMDSYVPHIWEFDEAIRPTLGVYLIGVAYKLFLWLGFTNPYTFHTILRFLTALAGFYISNYLILYFFKGKDFRIIFLLLVFNNLTWCLPFIRTLAGSEIWGGLVFLMALLFFFKYQRKEFQSMSSLFVVGFLLCTSFFFRFQMGFAILAMALWLLVYEKQRIQKMFFLGAGFLLAMVLNTFLDSLYYGKFVITPLRYLTVNIIEGRANEFGTSTPMFYFIELFFILFCLPLSTYVFYELFKGIWKQKQHLLVWVFLFFLIGHTLVGHKEERFIFPIIPILPLLLGLFMNQKHLLFFKKKWVTFFILPLSLLVNTIGLVVLMLIPYSQTVCFSKKIYQQFHKTSDVTHIYYIDRSPYQTISGLVHHFYLNGALEGKHIKLHKLSRLDSISSIDEGAYFCSTFNQLIDNASIYHIVHQQQIVFKSSSLLWDLNIVLNERGMNTINDVWIMYKMKKN